MKIGIDAREMSGKPTGVGRYLNNVLRYWTREFTAHSYYLYYRDVIDDVDLLSSPCVIKRHVPSRLFSFNIYWQQMQLPPLLKDDGIDILFSPSYSLPLRNKTKNAVTIHDVSFEAHPEWFSPREGFIHRFFTKRAAHKADIIFTVSQFSKTEIIKYYGAPENKIKVIPNGVDKRFQPIKDIQKIEDFRHKYNISGRILLYAGSIFNRRKLPVIMEAFKLLLAEYSDIHLLIAGENRTYPYQDLSALSQELGIGEKAHFFNFVDEDTLLLLYNVADIFIYLSEYEGFGIPLLEALACNTPAISSSNSALQEIFPSAALLVPNNEAEEVYNAVTKLFNNPQQYSELVENGKKLLQKYSYEKTAREIIEHLERLME